VAERDRLELSQPVATISAPKENRDLVVEEPAAAAGDNRRLIKHARCYWLLLSEGHLTRRSFTAMVRWIDLPPLPAG